MTFYTDNRFDRSTSTHCTIQAPIGPHGRCSSVTFQTKALSGYPGWHLLHMHGDYVHSVECSTRDVLGAITELHAEWAAEVKERWRKF
jgi:hypothetical protein